MVGIVFVSHSAEIAAGVIKLANQMVQGKVPLAAAGGIDDPENPIGTDAMKVYEAIESVYNDDGVVVLMDLGSALLSAKMAVEFFTLAQQGNISLSDAPFVEGALAAAVQASVGGTRQEVVAEARGALSMKISQLQQESEPDEIASNRIDIKPDDNRETITLTIRNRMGLHARPAAQLVSTASQYVADIQVRCGSRQANAKSINQVAMLGVRQGEEIEISAAGADASQGLRALKALVYESFGEANGEDEPGIDRAGQSILATGGMLVGIPVSPGIAVGPVMLYRPAIPEIIERPIDDPASEWIRLENSVANALREIKDLEEWSIQQVGASEAVIFQAHALFLQDPALIEVVKERIYGEKKNAEAIWDQEIAAAADKFRTLDNPYMQARAADIVDAGRRVLRHLMGAELPSLDFEQPALLIATDLSPSDTAQLDPANVLGICLELGEAVSHSAILARALDIPSIVGLGKGLWMIGEDDMVAMNGQTGQLWLHPSEGQQEELLVEWTLWRQAQEEAKLLGKEAAVTRDGHVVNIVANIGGPNDVAVAMAYGAEGVGLFRTEFLFMNRDSAPTEEEQFQAYAQVADTLGERPLIIRTLDVGGDKRLPYLDLGQEDNPFLGWRGIRFCLDRKDILRPQLRAALRASVKGNVKLMFPMVGSMAEIRAAKILLEEEKQILRDAGVPFIEEMEVGVMIEVPAAVATADLLAAEVDFFSIGSNDLTQYTMAADRGNANVSGLANALQPAVLRLIKQTVDAAHAAGIYVGICGELAGNANAAPLLVGLGVDELSMNAPSIPAVKENIRQISFDEARSIAKTALTLDSAAAVLEYLS